MKTSSPLTAKITLYTASGNFVHTCHIPAFLPPPEVILWGIRIFRFQDAGEQPEEGGGNYREVFHYAIPTVLAA